MKSFIKYVAMSTAIMSTTTTFAQKRTEKIQVSGNCDMCANKIAKAAKDAGASKATWNSETHILNVTYNASVTSTDSIQKQIAKVGYDTEKYTATMEAYNNLHECCKYENKRK